MVLMSAHSNATSDRYTQPEDELAKNYRTLADPMSANITITFSTNVKTKYNALKYLYTKAGYSILPKEQSKHLTDLYQQPLLKQHRMFKNVPARYIVDVLIGHEFFPVTDDINKLVSFEPAHKHIHSFPITPMSHNPKNLNQQQPNAISTKQTKIQAPIVLTHLLVKDGHLAASLTALVKTVGWADFKLHYPRDIILSNAFSITLDKLPLPATDDAMLEILKTVLSKAGISDLLIRLHVTDKIVVMVQNEGDIQ
jgi:hypothetical protein